MSCTSCAAPNVCVTSGDVNERGQSERRTYRNSDVTLVLWKATYRTCVSSAGTSGGGVNGRGNSAPLGLEDADEDAPPGYLTATGESLE